MIAKQHLEEVARFIKDTRSNESHFEQLYKKLEEEGELADGDPHYQQKLTDIKNKEAIAYRQVKETGGSSWPEYERFASSFEVAVLAALQEAN